MIPFWLYQLTPKDVLGAPVAVAHRKFVNSGGILAAEISVVLHSATEMHADDMAIILSWGALLTPGAGQVPRTARLVTRDSAGNLIAINAGWTRPDAGVNGIALPCGETTYAVLFSGEDLVLTATFDQGVNVNQVQAGCTGWIVPRGNLQR